MYFTIRRSLRTSINEKAISLLDQMKKIWKEDPSQVPPVWLDFLRLNPQVVGKKVEQLAVADVSKADAIHELFVTDQMQMHRIISLYQIRGHLMAAVDPLEIKRRSFVKNNARLPEELQSLARTMPLDKDQMIFLTANTFIGSQNQKILTVNEIIKRLNNSYCNTIGVEYMYIPSVDICQWIRKQIEDPNQVQRMQSTSVKKMILESLIRITRFQEFLKNTLLVKREALIEGCEMLIPALQVMIDIASAQGMNTNRARLNILANAFRKPLNHLFVPFTKFGLPDDAKNYFGSYIKKVSSAEALPTEFFVIANTPEYVECAELIVAGRTKAEQVFSEEDAKIWPIAVHTDAITNGQGTLFETMRLSRQSDYYTKGVIHIVLTDHTAVPAYDENANCCYYATDVARAVMAPVFHVNSRDPEAVAYAMKVATEYRIKFESDVVIDLIIFRKHFSSQEQIPTFLERRVSKMVPLIETYSKKLIDEKIITKYEVVDQIQKFENFFEFNVAKAARTSFDKEEWLDTPWKRFFEEKLQFEIPSTGIIKSFFSQLMEKFVKYPLDINVHPDILREVNERISMMQQDQLTWNGAEFLVFSSLLEEGIHVRLVGDEIDGGSYKNRHYELKAIDEERSRNPLKSIFKDHANFTVTNTISAELAVLGFETGFAQTNPKALVIWQSHKEDRTNVAQFIIDVFLAAGESMWSRQCGIVCLLPHGLEGEGDECSSARPKRFLQLCSDDEMAPEKNMGVQLNKCNWIVANVSTPANYFHILRRQVKLNFRKPLILFFPKKLFASKMTSSLEEVLGNTKFKVYIPDMERQNFEEVSKVLLCTGRVYYDLYEYRRFNDQTKQIAICRLEQISPFPYSDLENDLYNYKHASVYWVQEEHQNHGWWSYIRPRLSTILKIMYKKECDYIGRPFSPFHATNDYNEHLREKEAFLREAMKL
ncbi:2-oxoglutarate dehydrogenase complex component E1-like isoform X2 [Rhodnius prolixus]|uniref:2-oxoglutarate dehydrogenase complex component E1-like isoform X2 n=1 Tax=Rhodnius prolixus TaxID=13249 RepID=UPI003D18CC89